MAPKSLDDSIGFNLEPRNGILGFCDSLLNVCLVLSSGECPSGRKSYNCMPHLFTLFRSEISIAQQRTFPGVVQLMKLKLNC